jgi:hypothetical protein
MLRVGYEPVAAEEMTTQANPYFSHLKKRRLDPKNNEPECNRKSEA